jgi:hypothetical protein
MRLVIAWKSSKETDGLEEGVRRKDYKKSIEREREIKRVMPGNPDRLASSDIKVALVQIALFIGEAGRVAYLKVTML